MLYSYFLNLHLSLSDQSHIQASILHLSCPLRLLWVTDSFSDFSFFLSSLLSLSWLLLTLTVKDCFVDPDLALNGQVFCRQPLYWTLLDASSYCCMVVWSSVRTAAVNWHSQYIVPCFSALMVNVFSWLKERLSGFSIIKLPPPSSYFTIWKDVTMCSLHLKQEIHAPPT